jgi:hypothetical protein
MVRRFEQAAQEVPVCRWLLFYQKIGACRYRHRSGMSRGFIRPRSNFGTRRISGTIDPRKVLLFQCGMVRHVPVMCSFLIGLA